MIWLKASEVVLDFSNALQGMKMGHTVRREAWGENRPGLKIVGEGAYQRIVDVAPGIFVWVPSQDDILAVDWRLVE